MWLAEDDDTKIYILGTMHALPARTDWAGGKVAGAIASADELVMELSPAELARAGEIFAELAPRSAPLPMAERLSAEELADYHALDDEPHPDADRLDDWAILVLMGQSAAQRAGLKAAYGVETGLREQFSAAGKPMRGLESARAQLMMFENLDARTQRALLKAAVADADEAVSEVEALTDAWAAGDVAKLAAMINDDIDAVPAARAAIISERNRRWAAWAQTRMEQPGTLLMAVGAGHLVGDDGVPALLEARGVTVVRVQ